MKRDSPLVVDGPVALHLACQSLYKGESDVALVGGVNVLLSPEYYVAMSRMNTLSPTGRCKPFDHQADGVVLGEGAGAVLLKPLRRALQDGEHIHAVIKGSAVKHDGATNGLTASNPRAQAEVISRALEAAAVSAAEISYVEAATHLKRDKADNLSSVIPRETRNLVSQTRDSSFLSE